MGYRGTKKDSSNYFEFGETVTHQLYGTSSSITPHATHQKTELFNYVSPNFFKKEDTLSFTLYNGKKEKKF